MIFFIFCLIKRFFVIFRLKFWKSLQGFLITFFSIFYDLQITKRSYWKQNGLSKRKTIILKKIKYNSMSISTEDQKSFINKYRWGPINSFGFKCPMNMNHGNCAMITELLQYFNFVICVITTRCRFLHAVIFVFLLKTTDFPIFFPGSWNLYFVILIRWEFNKISW